jgi:hypothetical protein
VGAREPLKNNREHLERAKVTCSTGYVSSIFATYRSWEGWQVKRAERASRAPARSLQVPLKICDAHDVAPSALDCKLIQSHVIVSKNVVP